MRNVVAINEPPPFLRRYDPTAVFHFNRQDSKDTELKWDKLSVFDASVAAFCKVGSAWRNFLKLHKNGRIIK